MDSIKNRLEILFNLWNTKSIALGDSKFFVKDGIMNNEDSWFNQKRRIAFLLKDQPQKNGNWNDDVREWMNKPSVNELRDDFFGKIANLLYGLSLSTDNEDEQWWFGEIEKHHEDVKSFFNSNAFAYVECKKQPGNTWIDDNELTRYINSYQYLLCEEIEMLDPNIIVCMGEPIFNFLLKMYGATEENLAAEKNVYYIPSSKKVIIFAGHPSSRSGYQKHYDGTMHWFRSFLKSDKYKDFVDE
ncbi:MAG: hypothetical protein E7104_00265 [Prevotella sp.]|jgi:hypothetical protein|nr:hypothetical protein [Prevotella sp.]